MQRRKFLKCFAGGLIWPCLTGGQIRAQTPARSSEEERIRQLIERNRPSRLNRLPKDFNARIGATHVAGKYHLTDKPFLLEGADKLLELGTRLGKFWFSPNGAARDYPFNSRWGKYQTFVDLAKSDYFQSLFARPFSTIILEAHTPAENGWQSGQPAAFYEKVTQELYELTTWLYQNYRQRPITFIIQHWEGDWLLRGRGGEKWDPPPADWARRCAHMQHWLTARQTGVSKARAQYGTGALCTVAHAAEVNRVADLWKGIPTMTEKVLPQVTLDLVSYSAYDGLCDPLILWKCIAEIKKHARTSGLFGPSTVYLGEIGVPENEQPQRLAERWDEWMGVALAADVRYVVHWELYCNELNPKAKPMPKAPVKDGAQMRGFWLVRPDGSLSESGKYFKSFWQRASKERTQESH